MTSPLPTPPQAPSEAHRALWNAMFRLAHMDDMDKHVEALQLIADHVAQQTEALRAENARLAHHLQNILARIHGDGGHFTAEVGIDASVISANEKVAKIHGEAAEAEGRERRLRERDADLITSLRELEKEAEGYDDPKTACGLDAAIRSLSSTAAPTGRGEGGT